MKNITQSPQKMRLVADLVRGQKVDKALDQMVFLNKKAALYIKKALLSAVASADSLYGWSKENLIISHISVDEAKTRKSGRAASRGRMVRILKRRSHINLEVAPVK